MEFFNNVLDKDFPYLMIVGVCLLLAIFVCIAIALAKTVGYFVERFPKEEAEHKEYLNYKARADMLKAQVDAYNEQIGKLRDEYNLAIKEAKDNLTEIGIKDDLQKDLEKIERSLECAQTELFDTIKETAKSKSEAEFLNTALPRLKKDKEKIEKEIADLQNKEKSFKSPNSELSKYIKEIKELEDKRDKLDKEYRNLNSDFSDKKENISKLEDKLDKINSELSNKERVTKEIAELKRDLSRKESELSSVNNQLAIGKLELSKLEAICGKLSSEIQNHNNEKKKFEEGYQRLVCMPTSLSDFALNSQDDRFQDEITELRNFASYLEAQRFSFSERTINAFHTALKIQDFNPLTVLAGISGTGKTLLPTKYAEFFGIYSLVIPVEPRWDSPQDLLGFYNYLEKKYQATELSRTLVAFDSVNSYSQGNRVRSLKDAKAASVLGDRMLLVLLDEMNLARTEYYFANFLSRLELRRTVKDVNISAQRRKAEITIDDQFGNIWVPNNVLFVGTMNEDESTQTLSDKVLDRANLLRFGKPEDPDRLNGQPRRTAPIQAHNAMSYKDDYKKWLKTDLSYEGKDEISSILKEINDAMELIGKPFGYRVNQAIHAYISNYPTSESDEIFQYALSDQIEQKIMPKLRGLDLSDGNVDDCLTKISSIIDKTKDDALIEAFMKAKDDSLGSGMFMWQGVSRKV